MSFLTRQEKIIIKIPPAHSNLQSLPRICQQVRKDNIKPAYFTRKLTLRETILLAKK